MDEDIKIEGKEEIEEALKKLGEENIPTNTENAQDMYSDAPKMIGWVMKVFHLAQRPAEYVLIGVALVAFSMSLFLLFFNILPKKPSVVPMFQEDIEPSVRDSLPPGVWETIPSRYD